MAILDFDINSVEAKKNYDLLPPDWYTAQVIESAVRPLISGNGTGLKLTFEVLSDGYRNRRLWITLSLQHNNADAERISRKLLRQLCDSLGLSSLQDSNTLHFKPVQVSVKIRKDDTGCFQDENKIVGFKPIKPNLQKTARFFEANQLGGSAPSQPAVPTSTAAPAAPQAATPPWLKKSA